MTGSAKTSSSLALAAVLFAPSVRPCRAAAPALPDFPIGLYTAYEPSELPRIRAAGFDHVFLHAEPDKLAALATRAREEGMGVLLEPDAAMRGRQPVARWPVAAWYLQDEPEVWHVSPEQLAEKSRRVRAWDPRRAQVFVVGKGAAAKDYGGIGDALMLDWYPVPHLPLESVGEQIDLVRKALPLGKPLWFVVQAFDWRDDPPRVPGRKIGRFPDHAEIRFMSWQAILHRVDGLFYFRLHRPNGTTLWDYPELWQAVERVSLEMAAFKPVLVRGKEVPPPFAAGDKNLEARAWRRLGRGYVAILDRDGKAEAAVPAELLAPRWRPLFANRRDVRELLRCEGEACFLRPHQVLVLESRLWPF
jgi:hypothetical protein